MTLPIGTCRLEAAYLSKAYNMFCMHMLDMTRVTNNPGVVHFSVGEVFDLKHC